MNFLKETKQHYLFVMIIEFIFLSFLYWFCVSFNFSSILAYFVCVGFYITSYRFWIKILNNKENFLFDSSEQFTLISFIIFLSVLIFNSLSANDSYTNMFFVYLTLFIIFVFYYIFRIQKQKKSPIPATKLSSTVKATITLCCIFLLFDFIVYRADKLSIQLILYLPFLFLVLTFLFFIYKKIFELKSFFAAILFCNIYIMTTVFLVLNYLTTNFFSFTLLFHFIIFASVLYLMKVNSSLSKKHEFTQNKEFIFLLFVNVILIFISLNNIFYFPFPEIFKSYTYFVAISLIVYIIYHNYKTYIN